MFRIRKYYSEIIFFVIFYLRPGLSKFRDLENNSWINLDSSENIYEIYTNLNFMTNLLNLNHF